MFPSRLEHASPSGEVLDQLGQVVLRSYVGILTLDLTCGKLRLVGWTSVRRIVGPLGIHSTRNNIKGISGFTLLALNELVAGL